MPWTETRRLIGMFDILGFRAMLDEHGIGEMARRLRTLQRTLARYLKWEAQGIYFSDTIVVYGWRELSNTGIALHLQNDRMEAENSFRYCAMVMAEALFLGLPLRGGIAAGTCVLVPTRGVFLGQPIVHAYELEASQDWVGVALHESCHYLATPGQRGRIGSMVVATDIPLKKIGPTPGLTLDWPLMTHAPCDLRDNLAAIMETNRGSRHDARWQSTADFFDERLGLLEPAHVTHAGDGFLPRRTRDR